MNTNEFIVGIGTNGYSKKPQSYQIALIKKNTIFNYRMYDFNDIAELVGNRGHAITPAYLQGGMKRENFKSIQIFMLDFDGSDSNASKNITFQDVKSRADEYEIPIAFAYKTLSAPSAEPCYKFRVAFIHDIPLRDSNLAILAYRELLSIFPEADSACGELSRLFLGGKQLIYKDPDARFHLVKLIKNLYPVQKGSSGHFIRNLKSIVKKTDIAIINGRIAVDFVGNESVFGEKIGSDNIIIISEPGFSPIFYIKNTVNRVFHQDKTRSPKEMHELNIQGKTFPCRLLSDYFKGAELGHQERFLISTNLAHVSGGLRLFMDVLAKYYEASTVDKWEYDISTIGGYLPMSCSEDICPYYSECMSESVCTNIIQKLKSERKIFVKDDTAYVSCEEAYSTMENIMDSLVSNSKKGIHIIKGQTSLGKTRAVTVMVGKYENKRFLIAEPTCEMKNQLTKELRSAYSDEVASSMSVKDTIFISEEDKEHFQILHDSGRHHEASAFLNTLYKKCCEEEPLAKAKQEELKKISAGINACKDARITVTTHAMMIHTSQEVLESYDVIIIDEDILYLQILSNIKQISRGALEFIRSSGKYGYSQIASDILKKSPKEYHDIMAYYRDIPEWGELSPSDTDDTRDCDTSEFAMCQGENISDLRSAVSYYIDESGICHYFCCPELYNLNYIVLSATADASVYRDFFAKSGIGIMEYNVPRVRYTGSLTQYTYHSLGRRDIANRRKELYSFMDDLEETVTGNVYRISFMSEGMHAPKTNPWGLHYGNVTGDNRAKGKNLIIYGTPYKNPIAYLLPCCYIYGETAVNTDSMKNRRVNYKGRNFLIMAYNDAHLFGFEMYSLESELEQCIGRARLLRTSPKVYLLSSFPCEQAELITTDYLAKYKGEERSA